MDWQKAKTIILSMLIVMNIFLLVYMFSFGNSTAEFLKTMKTAEKILSDRGIKVENDIPTYHSDTPRLIYGNAEKVKTYTYDAHIEPNQSAIRKFLNGKNIANDKYVLDDTVINEDGSRVYLFTEKYMGFLVFDYYIKVTISIFDEVDIEMRDGVINGLSQDKVTDISAAYQILLKNFDGSNRLTIKTISIGYKYNNLEDQGSIKYFEQPPVWRILIKGSNVPLYFRTSDGEEIK